MDDLLILGAGGLGRELLQWAKDIGSADARTPWRICGFLDDNPDAIGDRACSHPVLSTIAHWQPGSADLVACGIADPNTKARLIPELAGRGARFTTLRHPTAIIGEHNEIGAGLIAYPNARVTANVTVGRFVTLLSCAIGHDAKIGDFATVSTASTLCAGVTVGARAFIATGAILIPGVRVGAGAYVGAGSVVLRDVPEGGRVAGNPARAIPGK